MTGVPSKLDLELSVVGGAVSSPLWKGLHADVLFCVLSPLAQHSSISEHPSFSPSPSLELHKDASRSAVVSNVKTTCVMIQSKSAKVFDSRGSWHPSWQQNIFHSLSETSDYCYSQHGNLVELQDTYMLHSKSLTEPPLCVLQGTRKGKSYNIKSKSGRDLSPCLLCFTQAWCVTSPMVVLKVIDLISG